ncbi:putative protein P17 [Pistachio ampelovirus A]|uniref:Uncharacterized protein n=1 Tax=Pistachio ampelovirus A TaxID=2093224 RepID=A0A499PZ42_9CLOS|nr:putative protein P17 [Pistachio ampelovirus A]AVN99307.1 putative protein P17 [Pistachio ampelovirus A]
MSLKHMGNIISDYERDYLELNRRRGNYGEPTIVNYNGADYGGYRRLDSSNYHNYDYFDPRRERDNKLLEVWNDHATELSQMKTRETRYEYERRMNIINEYDLELKKLKKEHEEKLKKAYDKHAERKRKSFIYRNLYR